MTMKVREGADTCTLGFDAAKDSCWGIVTRAMGWWTRRWLDVWGLKVSEATRWCDIKSGRWKSSVFGYGRHNLCDGISWAK